MRPDSLREAVSAALDRADAGDGLRAALNGPLRSARVALVSSFGAESAALLALVARVAPETPVLFIDTEMLFPETLAYQRELAARFGLRDVRRLRPDADEAAAEDPDADLHLRDVDACCALRKVRPLERALHGFDAWISGRKRFQSSTRREMASAELDAENRVKLNPLAKASAAQIRQMIDASGAPPHPLVAHGYPSIGCAPCTSRVAPGEDARAGRWRGAAKVECGIHVVDGRLVRAAR